MKTNRGLVLSFLVLLLIITTHNVKGQHPSGATSRNDPSVEGEYVKIVGAVLNPSRFQFQRPMRLFEAIQLAGGVAGETGSTVRIVHTKGNSGSCNAAVEVYKLTSLLHGDENANPYLRAGDIVIVDDVDKVYVIGNVFKPTAVLYRESITVSEAIILAGGVLRNSRIDKILVIRQTPNDFAKTEIKIDLKGIKEGRAKDLVLQPNDVVNVPYKGTYNGPTVCHFPMDSSKQLPLRIIE